MEAAAKTVELLTQRTLPDTPYYLSNSPDWRYRPRPDDHSRPEEWHSTRLQYSTLLAEADRGVLLTRPDYDMREEPPKPVSRDISSLSKSGGEKKKLSLSDYKNKKTAPTSASPPEPSIARLKESERAGASASASSSPAGSGTRPSSDHRINSESRKSLDGRPSDGRKPRPDTAADAKPRSRDYIADMRYEQPLTVSSTAFHPVTNLQLVFHRSRLRKITRYRPAHPRQAARNASPIMRTMLDHRKEVDRKTHGQTTSVHPTAMTPCGDGIPLCMAPITRSRRSSTARARSRAAPPRATALPPQLVIAVNLRMAAGLALAGSLPLSSKKARASQSCRHCCRHCVSVSRKTPRPNTKNMRDGDPMARRHLDQRSLTATAKRKSAKPDRYLRCCRQRFHL